MKRQIKPKKIIQCGMLLAGLYLCLCASLCLKPRPAAPAQGDCMLYYIINTDGMKGLGHTILMLKDEEGRGTVISFNGMQRTLGESLMGQSGVGKMSIETMDAEDTAAFLQTGSLHLEGDQLQDNYDRALYRPITAQEYRAVLAAAEPYLAAEAKFEALYTQWVFAKDDSQKDSCWQRLAQLGRDRSLPLYRLYTHNCDHAARELASAADSDMREYALRTWHITPNGNLKAFGSSSTRWGVIDLGETSPAEKILGFLMIF